MTRDWETVHDFHGDLRAVAVAVWTWRTPPTSVEARHPLTDLRPEWVVDYRTGRGAER